MLNPTSPIKILYFNNCELHCCHLDGYKSHREALSGRLREIESFFAGKPLDMKFRLWYNIDDSMLDETLIHDVAASLERIQSRIFKIAFIGLRRIDLWKLENKLKHIQSRRPIPRAYFTDAERAKEWLV